MMFNFFILLIFMFTEYFSYGTDPLPPPQLLREYRSQMNDGDNNTFPFIRRYTPLVSRNTSEQTYIPIDASLGEQTSQSQDTTSQQSDTQQDITQQDTTVRTTTQLSSSDTDLVNRVVQTAAAQVGKPYVYGSIGPNTFDCSGLMYYAYKQNGIKIPRTTKSILNAGTKVNSLDDVQPGDVIISPGGGENGMHAQMVKEVKDGKVIVISASNKKVGIQIKEFGKNKKFYGIRRFIGVSKAKSGIKLVPRNKIINKIHNKKASRK